MDRMLQQLFGDESQSQPADMGTGTPATQSASAQVADPAREARREARQQRKADHEARHRRKEFIDRYTTGDPTEGFTADEAIAHLREMRNEMSPSEFRQAMKQTLEQLPPDQRDEAIAMMQRYKQAANRGAPADDHARVAPKSAATSDPAAANEAAFGSMLDSLMGSGAGGTDFGAVVEDLRRGGLSAPRNTAGAAPTDADFEALLNSPLARAVLGGVAAYGLQNMAADDDHDTPSGSKSVRP